MTSSECSTVIVRPVRADEKERVVQFIIEHWGSPVVVGHGVVYEPAQLPALVAIEDGEWIGFLSYHIQDSACEIVSIDSVHGGRGVGSALIEAAKLVARQAGCRRLWLITTNDNLHALRFYQKRNFSLVAVHCNAVMEARKIKPQIPLLGNDDIPLRDEIELEMPL
ncbi:N-acetyltransferase [Dictyobacter vulcani]|uniref:N-acetyltransferase n=1 Tax=Dictyobacter vulcani TaxID=2607529 RepID=A0A5J4KLL3_9CHLR|nr:GNAT family N-acetyltransferase [Dictyobacter vulcani]GER88673.1 N-acetyltransferase [Dictyobacter vulcani]